jgi:putative nucleotidyltransferase with HDIG domain
METAICAPLMDHQRPFGVIQLDVRRPARGRFTREDVDLLSVFASQVSLALEHLRMGQQQRRAFESTITALLYSLTLKDPDAAAHSERVQAVAIELGRHLGLSADELEVLRVAALLHDLGKQGVSDEVLFKPDRLTDAEREEMSRHAALTQDILDKIVYPEHLRDVPRIAAWHHEKMDGTGPFRISGDSLPMACRILAVADVFDALLSQRVYRDPMPPKAVLAILKRGRGTEWDTRVVGAVQARVGDLLVKVYGSAAAESGEGLDRAA